MIALYVPGNSPVHRLPTGIKLTACLVGSAGLTLIHSPWILAGALLAIAGIYALARLPLNAVLTTLRPILLIAGMLFFIQLALSGWSQAAAVALRVTSLVLFAALVTLTTPLSEMIDTATWAASPLGRFGVSPPKFGLAIALTMRFIPALAKDWQEIESARAARGARKSSVFGIGSLVLRILCMTNALGEAIAARDFESRR